MADYIVIDHSDTAHRYHAVKKGFNLRWPETGQEAGSIYICTTEAEAQAALQDAVTAGLRPTIRSGGHCYEGFVSNNPGGAIIDVGLMTGMDTDVTVTLDGGTTHTYGFRVSAGNQNWDGYVNLYKRTGKTVPGGSCYSVGTGGHIVGGGYGLLSRLHGLTVDWLTGVDILLVQDGATVTKVHANASQNADLFKLCRGGGGGNVGLITSYYFDDMPLAPQQVAVLTLQYSWAHFKDDKAKFGKFLNAYAKFMVHADTKINTYGLFTLLKLTHITAGNLGLVVQYTDKDGTLNDTQPLLDFMNALERHAKATPLDTYLPGGHLPFVPTRAVQSRGAGTLPANTLVYDWLYATQTLNGSGNNQRGKYKSTYMKQSFTDTEIDALFQYLTVENASDTDFSQSLVQVDSYGGAINHLCGTNNGFDPSDNQTAVAQRSSVMKLQYQTYWTDAANDDKHIEWLRDFYYAMYAADGFNGTPYPYVNGDPTQPSPHYEGCYINYPDIDMLEGQAPGTANYEWGDLYYPGIYADLVATKNTYDPNNVFHHAMSVGSEPNA